jgi:uncharacterized protein with PIN domain
MLRFHLDENGERAIAEGARLRGLDFTTTPPDLAMSTPDPEQLAWCLAQERVIVTRDKDMLRHAAAGIPHAGVMFYRHHKKAYGQIITKLVTLSRLHSLESMKGRVEYL